MADGDRKRKKKVRIQEPFVKKPEIAFTDRTYWNPHTDTDDTDNDSQESTYAERDPSIGLNIFNEVEGRGLSVTLPLQPTDVQATIPATAQGASNSREPSLQILSNAWKGPKTIITQMNAEVESFTINSVELSGGNTQCERVIITCNEGPFGGETSQVKSKLCRWLHIKKSSLSLDVLEKFVMSCEPMSAELQEVAKQLLSEARTKFSTNTDRGPRVEAGAVIRYVGILPHVANKKRRETEPVIFASCPHLVLEEKRSMSKVDGQGAQTLLHHLYGHGSESSSASTQVVQKLEIGGPKEIIHVNQMWCLLIGSGCLITYSPKSASELQEGLVHQIPSKTPNQDSLNMILIYEDNLRFNAVIGPDWTYVDLLQYTVGLIWKAPWKASRFYLESPDGERLYAKAWMELVTSGSTDLGIFHIRRSKDGVRATHITENDTFRRSPQTPQQASRRISKSPAPVNHSRATSPEDPWTMNEAEKPVSGGTDEKDSTDFNSKIESHPIDYDENHCKFHEEEPPSRSSPASGSPEYLLGPARRGGFSVDDTESLVDNDFVQPSQRILQPKIYAPSPNNRDNWESSSAFSVETMHTDENQDSLSELGMRNIDSRAASETNLVPITKPFFQWRPKGARAERSNEELRLSIGSILKEVHSEMIDGGSRDIYRLAFRCSRGVLWLRNSFLPFDGQRDVDSPEAESEVDEGSNINLDIPQALTSNVDEEDVVSNEASTRDSVGQVRVMDSSEYVQSLMRTLFEISRGVVSSFLPSMEIPGDHEVLGRVWGALDTIFRKLQQLNWASLHGEEHWTNHYIIRDFDRFTTHSEMDPGLLSGSCLPFSQCEECSRPNMYFSIEAALEHLHGTHFLCEGQPVRRPFDDPCYVWILHVAKVGHDSMYQPLLSLTEDFVTDLQELDRIIKELHVLVARPGNLAGADKIIPPLLPRNLMLAFSEIVKIYILHSNRLSLMNQLEYLSARHSRHSLQDAKFWLRRDLKAAEQRQHVAMTTARELLEFSLEDVMMLEHTTRQVENAVVETVGLEFLALALMSNAQKRPIFSEPVINIEDIYRIQMSRMRSDASWRPKRRLFLELSALQEELDAVDGIVETQQSLLNNYLDLLAPGSFRKFNATRLKLYATERKFAERHERALHERHERLHSLQERAAALRKQVKQMIEILEEDHGKAIRVFTIVTLFFLPMSFISSFLGMNTTDIRDTEFDQRFFWIVSIPVTAVVVILAMTYGYKGDDINDWFYEKMHQPRQRLSRVVQVHHTDRSGTQAAPPSEGIQRSRTMELEQQLLKMRKQKSRGSQTRGRWSAKSQPVYRKHS